MTEDWTTVEARKAAKVYRRHGVKCRVVRSKNYEDRLHIYIREGDGLDSARKSAKAECLASAIDANTSLVRV